MVAILFALGFVLPLAGLLGSDGVVDQDAFTDAWTEWATAPTASDEVASQVDYTSDPAAAIDELRVALGGDVGDLLSLVVYPGYVIAEVEPVAAPGTAERWVVYPDRHSSTALDPSTHPPEVLDARRFTVDEVPVDVLPLSAIAAVMELAPDSGTITHVIVERRPEVGAVRIAVYVADADGGSAGYVSFGPGGERLSAHPA